MQSPLPQRRHPRLKHFDYATAGFYFVTACTQDRMTLLGEICCKEVLQISQTNTVGRLALKPPQNREILQDQQTTAVGRLALKPPQTTLISPEDVFVFLTPTGKLVEHYICRINDVYDTVKVDCFTVMPDHLHLLLQILPENDGGLRASRPTVETIVRSLKRMVNKQIGHNIWQRSFYEHIIRNEDDLRETRAYIQNNPAKRFFEHRT